MNDTTNFNQADAVNSFMLPWWKKLLRKPFLGWHPYSPDLPQWAKDGIMVDVSVHLSFIDHLRVLCFGKVHVRSWISCEQSPLRTETKSSAVVTYPDWM